MIERDASPLQADSTNLHAGLHSGCSHPFHPKEEAMRFRPLLFTFAVGAMVLAVPSDRGTPPEKEDTVPGPNVVPTGVGCSFALRRVPANAQRLICASSANSDFSSHMKKYRQPTGEGGSR